MCEASEVFAMFRIAFPRRVSLEEWGVIGCLGFVLLLGSGLLGLGFILYHRLFGSPLPSEGRMLMASLFCIVLSILIPVVRGIVSRIVG